MRLRKRHLALLAALLAALFALFRGTDAPPPSVPSASAPDRRGPARVEKVLDGDTIRLEGGETVRLIGVDAPETHHPDLPPQRFGEEATAFLRGMLEGEEVTLEIRPQEPKDKYGRTLAYVRKDGKLVNAELVRDGFAYAYSRFPHPRLDEFLALEREARRGRRGLWEASLVIPWEEAARHVGEHVTVEGRIVATHRTPKVCFLNFHKDWRRHLTVVIFASSFPRFPAEPEKAYKGRLVRVRGTVKEHEGRPEIILYDPSRIEVLP